MHELEELRKFFASLGRKTTVVEHEIAMMRARMQRAGKQRADHGKPKWRKVFGYQPYPGPK
jgi:hypothetical protein